MFTGLVEELGKVESIKHQGDGFSLTISARIILEDVKNGDSIAINGVCQTVTSFTDKSFSVYVSRVTAELTTLSSLINKQVVNLERAMQVASRFGGHIVQGHADGTGVIANTKKDNNGLEVEVALDQRMLKYIVPKGSICVDGISLTVVSVTDKSFFLYIIPETISNTNIPLWNVGDSVNIEIDILAKYVERMLNSSKDTEKANDGEIMEKLARGGYL